MASASLSSAASHRALVLLAHGSRDSAWQLPIEQLAQHVTERLRHSDKTQMRQWHLPVRCAYLEWTEPSLEVIVDTLVSEGVGCIQCMPLFWGQGYHLGKEIPARMAKLQTAYPGLELKTLVSPGQFHHMPAWVVDMLMSCMSSDKPISVDP
jgi:sirohydrochlorin cobaltochelatase